MECFGDWSSSASDEGGGGAEAPPSPSAARRDEQSCGVLAFHPGTELALLAHVRNSLGSEAYLSAPSAKPPSSLALEGSRGELLWRSCDVLRAIDEFCVKRHWMMHVGPEKGQILRDALREVIEGKAATRHSTNPRVPFVVVELGTYCGYASVLMGRAFVECFRAGYSLDFHLFTAEIDRGHAEVAAEIIRLGGMEDAVSVHRISYDGSETDLVGVISDALTKRFGQPPCGRGTVGIDFLFVDHDKDSYLPDLWRLEAAGMVRRGSRVVADNVVFAQIDDYLAYVRRKGEEGAVATRIVECSLEYSGAEDGDQPRESGSNRFCDGIEITDYLKDP